MDKGVPGKPDRAVVNEARDGSSPQAASIPDAGAVGFIPHPYIYDRYAVVRVVKARKFGGMWEVQGWFHKGWESPVRRKVTEFIPSDGEPLELRKAEMALADALREAEKSARATFHRAVRDLAAQGMAARSGETGTGSTEGNSPTPQGDAPNSHQEEPTHDQ